MSPKSWDGGKVAYSHRVRLEGSGTGRTAGQTERQDWSVRIFKAQNSHFELSLMATIPIVHSNNDICNPFPMNPPNVT